MVEPATGQFINAASLITVTFVKLAANTPESTKALVNADLYIQKEHLQTLTASKNILPLHEPFEQVNLG